MPCLEEEEAKLWERFLVRIGEDWDWYLEFTWDCWVLLDLPLPLPPLLLSVLCSVVPVGVPLPKPRGLGEWSGPPAGLVDGPDAGSSAFSRIEEPVL